MKKTSVCAVKPPAGCSQGESHEQTSHNENYMTVEIKRRDDWSEIACVHSQEITESILLLSLKIAYRGKRYVVSSELNV